MADDVKKLNYLNQLSNRMVRGAKPGKKNHPESGAFLVNTPNFSDAETPKEFLLQSNSDANISVLTNVTFTVASKTVTTTDNFNNVQVSDYIRPSTGGAFFQVKEIVNTTTLTLEENFIPSEEGSSGYTGDTDLHKLRYDNVKYSSYENIEGDALNQDFKYSTKKDEWVLEQGAIPGGPYPTESEGTLPFKESINFTFVHAGVTGPPDMNVVGHVDKYLPEPQNDSLYVSFTPVPYPSALSEPRDLTKLIVYRRGPEGGSYDPQTIEEDFVLAYTNNPVVDGYLPFSDLAQSAYIHPLSDYEETHSTNDSLPVFELKESDNNITNIYEEGTSIVINEGQPNEKYLTRDTEYTVDPLIGLVSIIDYADQEEPISAVFGTPSSAFNGVTVTSAEVPFDEATEEDFSDAEEWVENIDYGINKTNGSFGLFKDLAPNNTVRVETLSRGQQQDQTILGTLGAKENVTELRTEFFPIVRGSVRLTYSSTTGEQRRLVEGQDFILFYSNGIIRLTPGLYSKLKLLNITYTPATRVVTYVYPQGDNTYSFRVIKVPAYAPSDNILDIGFKSAESIDKVVSFKNNEIDLTGISQISPGRFQLSNSNKELSKVGYAFVDFSYTGNRLPYAPLMRYEPELIAGEDSIYLENTSPSDLNITAPSIVKITSIADRGYIEYAEIEDIVDLDTLNTRLDINPPITTGVKLPAYSFLDGGSVSFVTNGVIHEYGVGATSIIVEADPFLIKVGSLVKVGGKQINCVSQLLFDGPICTLILKTPLNHSSSDGDMTFSYTEKAVYAEGDNALLTNYPVIGSSLRAIEFQRQPLTGGDVGKEVRTQIKITSSQIIFIDEIYGQQPSTYSFDRDNEESLKELADRIVNDTGCPITYSEIRDVAGISSSSLDTTPQGLNPVQIPYKAKVFASVFKKTKESEDYKALTRGEVFGQNDYSINASIIRLTSPIKDGDRFKVSYTYPSFRDIQEDEEIKIKTKRFSGVLAGTSYRIVSDYLAKDQQFVQGLQESSYLDTVILPYFDEVEKQKRGPLPLGSKGVQVTPSSGSSEGGIENAHYNLREKWLSANLLWKISDYYKYRLESLSAEAQALSGSRYGNNDYSNSDKTINRVSDFKDVEHQANFGLSVFYPNNYKKNLPLKDGRFSLSYTSHDQVLAYNIAGTGYLYGPYSGFGTYVKDLQIGYTLKIPGDAKVYTVVAIETSYIIKVDSEVTDAPVLTSHPQDPGIGNPGGFYGTNYTVYRDDYLDRYSFDERGFAGSTAIGKAQGPFNLTEDNSLNIDISVDRGVTWKTVSVTFVESGVTSFFFGDTQSITEVSKKIFDETSQYLTCYVEGSYNWPSLNSELSKTFNMSWPLQIPETDDTSGLRNSLVLRSRDENTYIRFSSTDPHDLATKFGFVKDYIYRSNYSNDSAIESAKLELAARTPELPLLLAPLTESNKLDRGATGYMDPLRDAQPLIEYSSSVHNIKISEASSAATVIAGETGFEGNYIETTYAETQLMLSDYSTYSIETSVIYAQDIAFRQLMNQLNINGAINNFKLEGLSRFEAEAELSSNYIESGIPSFTITSNEDSNYDPRIVVGDKTNRPTVPVGDNYGLVNPYPVYFSNENYLGGYIPNPEGGWGSDATEFLYSSGKSYSFIMSVAVQLSSTIPGSSFRTTSTYIEIDDTSTITTINYVSFPTLVDLKSEVEGISGFTLTIVHPDPSYNYGTLVIMPTTYLTSPVNLPFGIRGDVGFYSISDKQFDDRVNQNTVRTSNLPSYISTYEDRILQLDASVSERGEKIGTNREYWLSYLLDKTYGPANTFLSAKKNMAEE